MENKKKKTSTIEPKPCTVCGVLYVKYTHGRYDIHKMRISKFCGKKCQRVGQIRWNKGKKMPHEYGERIRGFRLGAKASEETKKRMSLAQKGHSRGGWKFSEESRERMRNRVTTEITRKKLSEAQRGEKHWNWQGGVSNDREYQKRRHEKWREENYDYVLYLNGRRRIQKIGNGGSHTFEQWCELKNKYNLTCPMCKQQEPIIKLTRDHIVPISKGGSDNIDNIQPLCKPCNSKKNDKIISYVHAIN